MVDFTEKTAENAEIAEIYQGKSRQSAQSAAFFSELMVACVRQIS